MVTPPFTATAVSIETTANVENSYLDVNFKA